MRIPTGSIQQASDLSDEILNGADKLVNIVEAYAIIRPGVTERTLQDLQIVVDILQETVNDIKSESTIGIREEKDEDVAMVDDAVDDEDSEHDYEDNTADDHDTEDERDGEDEDASEQEDSPALLKRR